MEKQLSENKMGVMPVGRLLFNMAGPMIVSMLVQALYNVVDSVFVAQRMKMRCPPCRWLSRCRIL